MSKSPKSIIDRDLIHELTALLDETGLTEIEIEQDGKRIRVARGTTVAATPSAAVRVEVAPQPGAEVLLSVEGVVMAYPRIQPHVGVERLIMPATTASQTSPKSTFA